MCDAQKNGVLVLRMRIVVSGITNIVSINREEMLIIVKNCLCTLCVEHMMMLSPDIKPSRPVLHHH